VVPSWPPLNRRDGEVVGFAIGQTADGVTQIGRVARERVVRTAVHLGIANFVGGRARHRRQDN